MHELKQKAFFGILWSGSNTIFNQVILLIVKIILARLLLPEDFGLVAMAYIVISSLTIITSFNIGGAYIRDNKSNPEQAQNTLFWMGTFMNVVIATAGFIVAPFVGHFFQERLANPQDLNVLINIIRLLSAGYLLNILIIIPGANLTKNLRFKERVISGMCGTLTYGIVASTMAFMGYGIWSIVFGQLANHIINHLIILSKSPFFPSLKFNYKIAKKYLVYGRNGFFNTIMNIVTNVGDDTLIGKISGSIVLGFYSLAQHFAGLSISIISSMVNGIIFPVLSKVQENKKLFKKVYLKGFRVNMLFSIPAIFGSVVLAKEAVTVVFGMKWLPLVEIFYILVIAAFFNNLAASTVPIFNSLNKPHIPKNYRLIQFVIFLVLIYPFAIKYGVIGVALVMVIQSIVAIGYVFAKTSLEIEGFLKSICGILCKGVLSSLIMVFVINFFKMYFEVNLISLFGLIILGVITYFFIILVLDHDLRDDIREALSILKDKLFLK